MSGNCGGVAESDRAIGGLLGVCAGESLRFSRDAEGFDRRDIPVTAALLDLCRSYVDRRGNVLPIGTAAGHIGVPGPGWLISVAFTRPDIPALVGDTLELAAAAGFPRHTFGACVAYVELAAYLLAGWPTDEAINAAVGTPSSGGALPELSGEVDFDALTAGVWGTAAHRTRLRRIGRSCCTYDTGSPCSGWWTTRTSR